MKIAFFRYALYKKFFFLFPTIILNIFLPLKFLTNCISFKQFYFILKKCALFVSGYNI